VEKPLGLRRARTLQAGGKKPRGVDVLEERAKASMAEENQALKRLQVEMRCRLRELEVQARGHQEDPWADPRALDDGEGPFERLSEAIAGSAQARRRSSTSPAPRRPAQQRGRRQLPQRRP
ncbi:unnamed protein product, partial [Prorocentrum cordatum]